MSGADDKDARRRAWSTYWAQGALHSCVGSFDDRYSGAIGAFWDDIVAGIGPGARVLDLATGNGALPMRIWKRHGADVQVDAVDLATLAPSWYRPDAHPSITFHPGVSMEALPFADGHHDWVVSQYGFEYADREAALSECLRVLAPHGRLAFVMHHAESVLVAVGRQELANVQRLLAPDGLLHAARAAIPWVALARNGSADVARHPDALAARAAYNDAMVRLADAIVASKLPDALVEGRQWVHGLLSGPQAGDADAALRALDAYGDTLGGAALRTGEMLDHALDAAHVAAMARRLQSARPDATVEARPLRQAEGVLGWALTCR
ncbi:MAG TPA: class I SAM-dependent methyltransferase [Xanthomonadaceae bacterium]|nr:class I SAM-dependent methyltransferase [Xanthomonadaceae bacterium]